MNPKRFGCGCSSEDVKKPKRKRFNKPEKVWITKDLNGDYKVWGTPEAALEYLNSDDTTKTIDFDMIIDGVCSDIEVLLGLDSMENNTMVEVSFSAKPVILKECPCGHGNLLK